MAQVLNYPLPEQYLQTGVAKGTVTQVLAQYADKDVVLVPGASVPGTHEQLFAVYSRPPFGMDFSLDFFDLMDRYEALLKANPGKALVIQSQSVALLDTRGYVQGGTLEGGNIETFEFDPRAFDEGKWDCDDTHEMTKSVIEHPIFIDL